MATKKLTVTIPEDLLAEIRERAGQRGISAYVAEALRRQRGLDRVGGLPDWLQEEHGALSEENLTASPTELAASDAVDR